jgi:putative membrane protein
MKTKLFLSLGAVALLAACGGGDAPEAMQTDPYSDGAEAAGNTAPADDGTAAAAPAPQEFVNEAAASNVFEVEAAKIALEKTQSDEIRTFANTMLHHHNQNQTELKTAVGEAANGLRHAPELTADQRAQLDALRQAGGDFDAVYVRQQTAAHEKTLALLNEYIANGGVPVLTEYAQRTAGVVSGHLSDVKKLPSA